jgi:hypothetical protein
MTKSDLKSPKDSINPSACLVGRVNYIFEGKGAESSVKTKLLSRNINRKKGYIRSSTGELLFNYKKGYLKINTPRSQAFIGFFPKKKSVHLKDAVFHIANRYGNILVTSLDDAPISTSKHLLVQYFSEEKNNNWEIEKIVGDPYVLIKNTGDAPIIVKKVVGTVLLRGKNRENWKAYKVNINGFRTTELPLDSRSSQLKLQLPSDSFYVELRKIK